MSIEIADTNNGLPQVSKQTAEDPTLKQLNEVKEEIVTASGVLKTYFSLKRFTCSYKLP